VSKKSCYQYSFTFTGLAPNTNSTQTKNVQIDSDFVWIKGEYFADIASAGQTDSGRVIPLCTAYVQDTASSYYLSDAPVPLPSLFGIGEIPFILPVPYVFAGGGTIVLNVFNFDAANIYNLRITMTGMKQARTLPGMAPQQRRGA